MFNFNFDKRIIYVVIACLILFSVMNFSSEMFIYTLFTIPAVIIAITFHEYAHAFVADKLGDETPRMQGRLTLNPIAHLDPVGSILLLFAGFGWGKPVQIDTRNFNRNISQAKCEILVSIAGPISNFILSIIFTFVYAIVYKFAPNTFLNSSIGYVIIILIQECIIINIGLGVFNLLPLPPLDGSKIFINLFSYNAKRWIIEHERYFYYAFLIIWITGISRIIIAPIISGFGNGLIYLIFKIFGMHI